MYSLTYVFGPTATTWALMFKTKERAEAVWNTRTTEDGIFHAVDDFGQTVRLAYKDIVGSMFEDLDQSKLAHIERALHQARTQAKGHQMASADPVLKTAQMANGPGMINPMGRN